MPDLGGAIVILTRAAADNAPLAFALQRRGARVVELTCVATRPLTDLAPLRQAVRSLGQRDRLVLTSRAAADAVGAALAGDRIAAPVAVVGAATHAAANRAGLRPDFVASRPDGATLARELPLPDGHVLLARSDRALPTLPRLLRARGARVREVVAYYTEVATAADVAQARAALEETCPVVCFASPSAVDGFLTLVGADLAARARPVAIGATTAARARERLGADCVVAASPDRDAIARAVADSLLEVADGARH